MKPFYFVEHTADIAMIVNAEKIEGLFIFAAAGLASQLFPAKEKTENYKSLQKEISLEATSQTDLMVDWLNEVIYYFFAEHLLYKDAVITVLNGNSFVAQVAWLVIPEKDRKFAREIKAATYHDLRIEKKDAGLQAQIIFDV